MGGSTDDDGDGDGDAVRRATAEEAVAAVPITDAERLIVGQRAKKQTTCRLTDQCIRGLRIDYHQTTSVDDLETKSEVHAAGTGRCRPEGWRTPTRPQRWGH